MTNTSELEWSLDFLSFIVAVGTMGVFGVPVFVGSLALFGYLKHIFSATKTEE